MSGRQHDKSHPKTVQVPVVIKKVKSLLKKENPLILKAIALKLGKYLVIHKDLKHKKYFS